MKNQAFKRIGFFLLYTFSITWFCWFIIIVANHYFDVLVYGTPLFWLPYTIGSLAPAMSAYFVFRQFRNDFKENSFSKFIFGGKTAGKSWLIFGLFLVWRFSMIWIAFGIDKPISILSMLLNLPFIIVLGGLEELGWRGILQPKLEIIMGYLPSIFVVGIIWSVWHLPLWWINGTVQSGLPFGLYLVSGIVLTASFTTLYKYTNNLFLCILSHAWFNGCIGLALYLGNNGVLQININWKVMVVFFIELIVSVVLGMIYSRKKNLKESKAKKAKNKIY
jgi:uncharacterized protein